MIAVHRDRALPIIEQAIRDAVEEETERCLSVVSAAADNFGAGDEPGDMAERLTKEIARGLRARVTT